MSEPMNTFAPHDPAHDEITRDGRCVTCMVSELGRLDVTVEALRGELDRLRGDAGETAPAPSPEAIEAAMADWADMPANTVLRELVTHVLRAAYAIDWVRGAGSPAGDPELNP